jgi:23S rRNA (uracil1939-C5)-methyltransferase
MAHNPRRILYVSCNPDPLIEEATSLVRHAGYHVRSTGVVDMFPHTNHVESVTLFERG